MTDRFEVYMRTLQNQDRAAAVGGGIKGRFAAQKTRNRKIASAEDWIGGKIRHPDELDIRSTAGDFMLYRFDIGWER